MAMNGKQFDRLWAAGSAPASAFTAVLAIVRISQADLATETGAQTRLFRAGDVTAGCLSEDFTSVPDGSAEGHDFTSACHMHV